MNNYITNNFKILPINLNPQQACIFMGKSNYGVICHVVKNQVQEVIGLVTKEDLKRADRLNINNLLELKPTLPPTIIVNSQCDAEIQVSFPANIQENIENLKGAVVVNNQAVVGIITVPQIHAYLNSLKIKGDIELGGDVEVGNDVEYSPNQNNFVFPG
ncbi:MAG: hypothetical protein AAFV71_01840 [Cyanobacteria bacterium J06633_8]